MFLVLFTVVIITGEIILLILINILLSILFDLVCCFQCISFLVQQIQLVMYYDLKDAFFSRVWSQLKLGTRKAPKRAGFLIRVEFPTFNILMGLV